jgi:hypothetical protein
MIKLSDRIRPNSEAAPWVVEEVRKMENLLKAAHDTLKDATDNCLWRSDSEFPLDEKESSRLYFLATETLIKLEPYK